MPSDLPRIVIYTTEEKRTTLRLISAAMGKSANQLINDLLDEFIDKYGKAVKVNQSELPKVKAKTK